MLASQAHYMLDLIMPRVLCSPEDERISGSQTLKQMVQVLCEVSECRTSGCLKTEVIPGKMWMESGRLGSQSCMKVSLQATFMLMRWFCTCTAISPIQTTPHSTANLPR